MNNVGYIVWKITIRKEVLNPKYGIELLMKLVESPEKNSRRSLNNEIVLATTVTLHDQRLIAREKIRPSDGVLRLLLYLVHTPSLKSTASFH